MQVKALTSIAMKCLLCEVRKNYHPFVCVSCVSVSLTHKDGGSENEKVSASKVGCLCQMGVYCLAMNLGCFGNRKVHVGFSTG